MATMNADQLLALLKSLDDAQLEAFQKYTKTYDEPLDNIWMILGGVLVFFMHAGFSMIESGTVRMTNVQSILSKNLLTTCIGFISWYFLGFGFAFGEDDGTHFIGGAGSSGFVGRDFVGTDKLRNWFFQGAFCATAGTIVSGAMAERTKIIGFVIYVILLTSFLYPVVVHWGWSGSGFLSYDSKSSIGNVGYLDFAGSGIVHMVGGIAAMCGAAIVGSRNDRFERPGDFEPHNVPLIVLGTLVLWFGWYGFNGSSTLSMKTKDDAYLGALVVVNTTLAPAVAGVIVFVLRATLCGPRKFDVCGICNGILAGLVSITAPCGFVEPGEAVAIGCIGGVIYQGVSMLVPKLKVDDPIDAFAVHGACGIWGVLSLGFFGENGCFKGGDQIGIQLFGIFVITLWTVGLSLPVFALLRVTRLLRVSKEVQDEGMDKSEHQPSQGYSIETTQKMTESHPPEEEKKEVQETMVACV